MTDVWTAEDDAILDARRLAKLTAEATLWATPEERTCERGTTITLHDPAAQTADSGVSWGTCVQVVASPGQPEVIMRAPIGDRVRAGHGAALDLVIAEVNAEMAQWERVVEFNAPVFEFVREADVVLLETRLRPDELTDHGRFWIAREFDSIMVNHVPDDAFGEHMEAIHVGDDEDCVCDACLQEEGCRDND